MPSGITADIYEGKDVSLRDYLLTVARQYGFTVHQKDELPGAPPRRRQPHTSYHDESLRDAQNRLVKARGWDDDTARDVSESRRIERTEARAKLRREQRELKQRYEKMIAKVYEWNPGDEEVLGNVKEGAIKFLRDSIDFDCQDGGYLSKDRDPQPISGPDFREQEIKQAQKDIDYHTKHRQEEIDRCAETNVLIDKLYEALPPETA